MEGGRYLWRRRVSQGGGVGRRNVVVAFDCATDATAVALLEPNLDGSGWSVVASVRDELGARHGGGVLLPLIQRLLERAGLAQENVGALVVGTGPGTFTGVRIAVSTGRALALALACPVFGVGTLDAIAAQAIVEMDIVAPYAEGAAVVPLVDARRRQVFAATYARSATGWKAGEIFAAEPGEVVSRVRGGWEGARVLCTGAEALVDKCRVEDAGATLPRVFDAAYLVLGQERLSGGGKLQADLVKACRVAGGVSVASARAGQWGSPESVTPIYVRPPDADIHITKMKDPWSGT